MRQSRNHPGDKPRWTQSTSLGFMLYNAPFQWGSPTPLQHSPTDGREKGGDGGTAENPTPLALSWVQATSPPWGGLG